VTAVQSSRSNPNKWWRCDCGRRGRERGWRSGSQAQRDRSPVTATRDARLRLVL